MPALTSQDDGVKRQIAKLKQQLKKREMRTAVGDKSKVIKTLSSDGVEDNSKLVPTVFADVLVNGVPVKTLNTGSPAHSADSAHRFEWTKCANILISLGFGNFPCVITGGMTLQRLCANNARFYTADGWIHYRYVRCNLGYVRSFLFCRQ